MTRCRIRRTLTPILPPPLPRPRETFPNQGLTGGRSVVQLDDGQGSPEPVEHAPIGCIAAPDPKANRQQFRKSFLGLQTERMFLRTFGVIVDAGASITANRILSP